MIRVYVAGKYSDDNVLSVLGNIGKGINLCKDLLIMGYAPFCPWLDHQYVLHMTEKQRNEIGVSVFHEFSLAWLDVSDCVLVIPERIETSVGVQTELQRARKLGLPIFYSTDDLIRWSENAAVTI